MTKKLEAKILKYYTTYYKDALGIPNWQKLSESQLQEEKEELLRIPKLEKYLGEFAGKKILDVGCGTGGFVLASSISGADAYGVEPDEKALEICLIKKHELGLKKAEFKKGTGEKLPFKNNKFDLVHSLTVLEHVQDVEKTIKEMVRVTKKGGLVYIKTPNYLSFYEGHYKIFWLPLFPKKIARLYLKIRQRPNDFINSINYVTPEKYKQVFIKNNFNYKFINNPIMLQQGLINFPIYLYQKLFNVQQNIELIIKV